MYITAFKTDLFYTTSLFWDNPFSKNIQILLVDPDTCIRDYPLTLLKEVVISYLRNDFSDDSVSWMMEEYLELNESGLNLFQFEDEENGKASNY